MQCEKCGHEGFYHLAKIERCWCGCPPASTEKKIKVQTPPQPKNQHAQLTSQPAP